MLVVIIHQGRVKVRVIWERECSRIKVEVIWERNSRQKLRRVGSSFLVHASAAPTLRGVIPSSRGKTFLTVYIIAIYYIIVYHIYIYIIM